MPKRIPVLIAKEVAIKCDCSQVILLAYDGHLTHVVTYGKTLEDCDMAAQGGNMLKQKWGWPERLMAEPPRVKKLQDEINRLKQQIADMGDPA